MVHINACFFCFYLLFQCIGLAITSNRNGQQVGSIVLTGDYLAFRFHTCNIVVKKNVSNIKYYLYAFPPSRLFDYASGFILGRFFICHKNMRLVKKKATFLEIISVNIIIGYLLIFPYISDYFSRSIMYLPGAALVIYVFAIGKGKISGFLAVHLWLLPE